MPIGAPKTLIACRRFFVEPSSAKQRQYEAFRAFFVEGRQSSEVARAFGYTPGSFQVMCHAFRRDRHPDFFASPKPGPRSQPKKSAARDTIVELRKRNHSVYEISEVLKARSIGLSPTAVREVLKVEGFGPLPRRLDEERPKRSRPTIEATADTRQLSLASRSFETSCGGLFLFVPGLVALDLEGVAKAAGLPGSKMIPASHALRSMLALKLWSIEHRSHVMPTVADEGLGLLAGLNVIPKRSFLSEYSSRVGHGQIVRLLESYHKRIAGEHLFAGDSFNLDFHSIPYYGEHPSVQRHFVAMRSRRQKSVLKVITRYAQRMLIENALSDAVRFFHMNALTSTVGIKVDFDMALLVIASGLYRLLGRKMRGYADAHADTIFRDLVDMPATVTVAAKQVTVRFHRRAHLPIIIDSGMLNNPIQVPWWDGASLLLTT
jgi:hypothetical protein